MPYQFTPLAEQDLKEIYRYTIKTWGKKQAKHYAGLLEKRFNDIASNTARVQNLSALRPDVMVSRCKHHYIFFTNPDDQKPQIFAVFHERMNQIRTAERKTIKYNYITRLYSYILLSPPDRKLKIKKYDRIIYQ